jgi:hypothetical protein
MAYTLKTSGVATALTMLIGVEQGGTTGADIKDFKGTAVTPNASVSVTTSGSWNGTARTYFTTTKSDNYTPLGVAITTGSGAWTGNTDVSFFCAVHSLGAIGGSAAFMETTGGTTDDYGPRILTNTTSKIYQGGVNIFASTSTFASGTKLSFAGASNVINAGANTANRWWYKAEGTALTTTDNTTETGAAAYGNRSPIYIGGVSGYSTVVGSYYLYALFNRTLTQAEVTALHLDPWAELFQATSTSIAPLAGPFGRLIAGNIW